QYKGRIVEPITPNELFYCVTKNVVDPKVNVDLWHLEVNGLVQNSAIWRFQDFVGLPAHEQQTTLMCISNGLDAGLISNAIWKGVPLRDLLERAAPLSSAARVRFHGVDNYTDTIPVEKAMEPTTLLAYDMNGVRLPHRHGYPLRVIVPGYSGGKLGWSLWKTQWNPVAAGDYMVVVRATDGEGHVQEWKSDRGRFSGVAGLHYVTVQITA